MIQVSPDGKIVKPDCSQKLCSDWVLDSDEFMVLQLKSPTKTTFPVGLSEKHLSHSNERPSKYTVDVTDGGLYVQQKSVNQRLEPGKISIHVDSIFPTEISGRERYRRVFLIRKVTPPPLLFLSLLTMK